MWPLRINKMKLSLILTERIPHPVGTKAKTQANMSATVSSVITIAATKPAIASRKETP